MFVDIKDLFKLLSEDGVLVLVSKPRQLTRFRVLLQSLASGDFNPSHCVPGFEDVSIFKALVSQGIGIVARAESEFLQQVRFETPPEVIAFGIQELRYVSPLKCGDLYQYRFELTRMVLKKNIWRADCKITCRVIEPEMREVVVWLWKVGFVEHPEADQKKLQRMQPKSYAANVLEHFVFRPAAVVGKVSVIASTVTAVLCCGLHWSTIVQMKSLCVPDRPCYVGISPM